MKIAIISHKTSNLINSRGNLIKLLIERGHEIVAICNEDTSEDKIKALGAKYRRATFDRTSTNIFANIDYYNNLKRILKEENVDAVFAYTIKPIIFGSIAAKQCNIHRIYSLVTGMGYNYSVNSIRVRFIRFFCNIGYRIALKKNSKVIFQNREDMQDLINKKYINKEQAELVDGTGVDMKKFQRKTNIVSENFCFLMVSRMLNVKGVIEYCKAAEIIKEKYPQTKFIHLGEEDDSYRGIKKEFINKYKENGIVEFKGRVKNVDEYLEKCNVVVLPSYLREGIPRTLQEALAVGRPIITTNLRGCKETVIENQNGYLVRPKNVEDLVIAMENFLLKDNKEIQLMSDKSYELAVKRFDMNIINDKIVKIIEGDKKHIDR